MQNYQNTDTLARRWDHLVDVSTGRTLGLDPGEVTKEGVLQWVEPVTEAKDEDGNTVTVVGEPEQATLPDDFEDEYLKPVDSPEPAPVAPVKSTKGATPEPAEAPAEAESPKE